MAVESLAARALRACPDPALLDGPRLGGPRPHDLRLGGRRAVGPRFAGPLSDPPESVRPEAARRGSSAVAGEHPRRRSAASRKRVDRLPLWAARGVAAASPLALAEDPRSMVVRSMAAVRSMAVARPIVAARSTEQRVARVWAQPLSPGCRPRPLSSSSTACAARRPTALPTAFPAGGARCRPRCRASLSVAWRGLSSPARLRPRLPPGRHRRSRPRSAAGKRVSGASLLAPRSSNSVARSP